MPKDKNAASRREIARIAAMTGSRSSEHGKGTPDARTRLTPTEESYVLQRRAQGQSYTDSLQTSNLADSLYGYPKYKIISEGLGAHAIRLFGQEEAHKKMRRLAFKFPGRLDFASKEAVPLTVQGISYVGLVPTDETQEKLMPEFEAAGTMLNLKEPIEIRSLVIGNFGRNHQDAESAAGILNQRLADNPAIGRLVLGKLTVQAIRLDER